MTSLYFVSGLSSLYSMPLAPGAKLGPYEIVAPLGSAHGSDVYKATHAGESRTVAIRVFPPDWAGEAGFPQLKDHFDRQAQACITLAHPNIGLLYDIGEQDGLDFVVTEFVEGETLAARLQRGPLPLNEAMQVALAIGDALDKAHRAGIVHQAVKPSNVMLTRTGAKLLDFGLADLRPSKAAVVPQSAMATVGVAGAKLSGIHIEYTSPEQLEGKPGDARADIFSFGATVYEMVTAKKAFEGKSRAVLIAAITTAEPDPLTLFQPKAPRALQHVVERCLEKDPEDRWQTAHDMMVQLRWITEGGVPVTAADGQAKPDRKIQVLLAAAVFAVAVLASAAVIYFRGPAQPGRFQFRVPVVGANPSNFALSPDGKTIALVAKPGSQEASSLYVRRVGSLAFNKLLGTEDAEQPFWSPDSRFIGYAAKGRLRKVSVAGGAPQDIAQAAGFSGGAWNKEGIILFGSEKGLQRVSAEGGTPAGVTTVAGKDSGHFWPGFLPDGRHFLYLAWSGEATNRAVFLGSLDSKDKTRLMTAASNAMYAPPGYLLFHREASLFAQPFDPGNGALSGEPVHVADEVFSNPANGRGSFDVSQNGVLLYYQGTGATAGRAGILGDARFAWFDRTGREVAEGGAQGPYGDMDVSPDGKLIALTRQEPGSQGADIWVMDWQRAGVVTRLTLDTADDINPVWSHDGTRIAFTTYRKGNADIYVKNANGSGGETPLLASPVDEMVEDWSRDGRYIAYLTGQNNATDIYALPLSGDQKPFPVVQGNFRKNEPQFSYDAKWLAYTSDESGTFQVYVMSFPSGDQRLQVSTEGGGQPRWKRDGKELFYRSLDGRVMVVDMKTVGKLESGIPRLVFAPGTTNPTGIDPVRHMTSVTADGQRFLIRTFFNTGRASATGAVPFAQVFATGQAAGGASEIRRPGNLGNTFRGNLGNTSNGLTVIQYWTAGLTP